jgi:hypothetical protein
MAQTGFTPIQIYSSSTVASVPLASNLVAGELAINTTDGKLFYKDNLNAVQVIGWKLVPATAGGTGLSTYTTGDIIYSSATNTLGKLGIGSAGQVLTVVAGLPAWAAAGSSMVYPGAGIPNSTGTAWGTSYGVTGTGSVVLSDSPTLSGTVNISSLSASQAVFTDASDNLVSVATTGTGNVVLADGPSLTGAVTIGSTTGTATVTLGQSTGAQTVNIATGVNNLSAKTVNIGTGATNGATTVNIAPSATTNGTTTVNIATQARNSNTTTVNIGTNATGGNSNINLGSSGAATVISSNGIIQQRIYTGINAQTATAGRVAFVSDHRSSAAYPIFGEAYSTSGTFGPFNVPVFADGTIWRVG